MGRDGKPNRLNIGEVDKSPPPSTPSRPSRLGINDAAADSGAKHPKRLAIPEVAPPAVEPDRKAHRLAIPEVAASPPAPERHPHRLGVADQPDVPRTPERPERAPSKIDLLCEKAQQTDPGVTAARVRGRIQTILPMTISSILDWGQRNLTPLQNISALQAKVSGEVSRIDASGWIHRTCEASCKVPGLLDRFNSRPPAYYEAMLNKTRGELQSFVVQLDEMKRTFFREISDLHLDAVAMLVCFDEFTDDACKMAAQNRGKTLLMAHQTAATLQATIEQSLINCANYIQEIDKILTVTIPQWKIAFQSR